MPTCQATGEDCGLVERRFSVAEYRRCHPDYDALSAVGSLHAATCGRTCEQTQDSRVDKCIFVCRSQRAATLHKAAYGNVLWMNTVFGDERIFLQKGVVP